MKLLLVYIYFPTHIGDIGGLEVIVQVASRESGESWPRYVGSDDAVRLASTIAARCQTTFNVFKLIR